MEFRNKNKRTNKQTNKRKSDRISYVLFCDWRKKSFVLFNTNSVYSAHLKASLYNFSDKKMNRFAMLIAFVTNWKFPLVWFRIAYLWMKSVDMIGLVLILFRISVIIYPCHTHLIVPSIVCDFRQSFVFKNFQQFYSIYRLAEANALTLAVVGRFLSSADALFVSYLSQ